MTHSTRLRHRRCQRAQADACFRLYRRYCLTVVGVVGVSLAIECVLACLRFALTGDFPLPWLIQCTIGLALFVLLESGVLFWLWREIRREIRKERA